MPSPQPRPSLLLGAFPPELAGLDTTPPLGWEVRCTGVGAVVAGVATAHLIAELKPSRVLFVGTCGAYDDRLAVGDFFEVAEVHSLSHEELTGAAYRPEVERVRWPATLELGSVLGFPAYVVGVPLAITRTFEGAQGLAAFVAAENLELTGVFAACHHAGIPCGSLLAVADRVGPDSHREWVANNARVSMALMIELKAKGLFDLA